MLLTKEEFIDICKLKSEEELWEWVKEYAYNLTHCNELKTDKEREWLCSQVNELTRIINLLDWHPIMSPSLIVRRQRYIDRLNRYEDEAASYIK